MDNYTIPLGTSGDSIVVKVNPILGGMQMFHLGERIKRKFLANKFTVTDTSGAEHEIRLKGNFLDSLPGILVDGVEQPYAPPLPTPIKIITGSTLIILIASILVAGGLIGALIGGAGWWLSQNAARSIENKTTATLVSIAIAGAAWLLYIVLVVLAVVATA
jgi:hypothetical protein